MLSLKSINSMQDPEDVLGYIEYCLSSLLSFVFKLMFLIFNFFSWQDYVFSAQARLLLNGLTLKGGRAAKSCVS
jgi:hypothetical protein